MKSKIVQPGGGANPLPIDPRWEECEIPLEAIEAGVEAAVAQGFPEVSEVSWR